MGGQTFILRRVARNADVAFDQLREDAIEEYGNDPYSGTISTCASFADITVEFKRSGKSAFDFAKSKLEDMSKRECYAIAEAEPKVNTNKIKSTVEHAIVKGTSKWDLKYVVYTGWEDRMLESFKTKAEAVKFARQYTEGTKETTFVRMEKWLVNQNANVACIKYKSSSDEKNGQYLFFGIAAC